MNSVFISGIPASGKSTLADKLSKQLGMDILSTDDLREEMSKDKDLSPWVHFFSNLDEQAYYLTTSCHEQWLNLVKQSEAFWPTIIKAVRRKKTPLILEGVNILPHLASNDLEFTGVYLLGESEQIILERLKLDPRWGLTEELQMLEAHAFYNCEARMYKSEAQKFGYETFSNADNAYATILQIIKRESE